KLDTLQRGRLRDVATPSDRAAGRTLRGEISAGLRRRFAETFESIDAGEALFVVAVVGADVHAEPVIEPRALEADFVGSELLCVERAQLIDRDRSRKHAGGTR